MCGICWCVVREIEVDVVDFMSVVLSHHGSDLILVVAIRLNH